MSIPECCFIYFNCPVDLSKPLNMVSGDFINYPDGSIFVADKCGIYIPYSAEVQERKLTTIK